MLQGPLRKRRGPRNAELLCYSLNTLENSSLVKESGVGVTPVSKKHAPPNDRPIACTFCVALMKDAVTSGSVPGLPSQSDHSAGLNMSAVIVCDWFPASSCMFTGFDHQYWV